LYVRDLDSHHTSPRRGAPPPVRADRLKIRGGGGSFLHWAGLLAFPALFFQKRKKREFTLKKHRTKTVSLGQSVSLLKEKQLSLMILLQVHLQ
jgi:hypothetical protein